MKRAIIQGLKLARHLARLVFPSLAEVVQKRINERNERRHWDERIKDVLTCPDNVLLPRVANAGKVINGYQVMHNGIEVVVNGYYGNGITRMLEANRGCHEPQEEALFQTIVRSLSPGAVMIEAGAYWAFYSMWFCKEVSEAKTYLIEPEKGNLEIGRNNFAHNNCCGDFSHGYVGAKPGTANDGVGVVALDEFAAQRGLTHIHVLHADVQGSEMDMLSGCHHLLSSHSLDYLFISTHSQMLHRRCSDTLEQHGYRILATVDMLETYSVDGILVACSPRVIPPKFSQPSKKRHFSP